MMRQANSSNNLTADIPSNYSRLIARELDLTAKQLPCLLRGTGLGVAQFLSEDSLLSATQQVQILRNALALSGKPEFGLRLGKRLTPATHGAMGFAASSSPNLLSALEATAEKMMLSRPPGTLSEDEAAASLFMSKRTMARKLKAEQSGFRQIRDEIMSQQAASYLCDSELSIEAIAVLMNYHDSANFRRAFKRWFEQSPEKFRLNTKSQIKHLVDRES